MTDLSNEHENAQNEGIRFSLSNCTLCPLACGADRAKALGRCLAGDVPRVARAALHHWEEPPISGTRGSGAVFFSGCNMRCAFCQNHAISQSVSGVPCDADALARIFLNLQEQGAHNINLVTPAPHVLTLAGAIAAAKARGLTIPIVYNTNAFERVGALKLLDGLVDIYLPDLKFHSPQLSGLWAKTEDYFSFAAPALCEMQRQVGVLALGESGLAARGLIVRHLVLPNARREAYELLKWLRAHLPSTTRLSIMRQYTPAHRVLTHPHLYRRITKNEYESVVDFALGLGFENIFTQKKEAASAAYVPEFDGTGVTFFPTS